MPDARLNTGLAAHPKTKKLIRRLGPGAAWSLVCLILWARENRPNGSLAGMTAEDIELACDWTGENGALVRELVSVGFLDASETGYLLHDWADHQPWANGESDRSERARWAALCRQHGRARAAELMPAYASRLSNPASGTPNRAASKNVAGDPKEPPQEDVLPDSAISAKSSAASTPSSAASTDLASDLAAKTGKTAAPSPSPYPSPYPKASTPKPPPPPGPADGTDPDPEGGGCESPPPSPQPTPAAAAAIALRQAGKAITSQHPDLIAATETEGVTPEELLEMAELYPDKPAAYIVAAARSQHAQRASTIPTTGGKSHAQRPSSVDRTESALRDFLADHGA